jgi:serine/threonine protein phosphatase PrpC
VDILNHRKNMEDAHIACTEVADVCHKHEGDMVGLFGVFDGHGGV